MRIFLALLPLLGFYLAPAQNCRKLERWGDLAAKSKHYVKAIRRYNAALECHPTGWYRLNKKMDRAARALVRRSRGNPLPYSLPSKLARGAYNLALVDYYLNRDSALAWGISRYCIAKYFRNEGARLSFAALSVNPSCWRQTAYGKALKGHTQSIHSITFSPDGRYLASAALDSTVRVWDLEGNEIRQYTDPDDKLLSVAFSPDGNTIAVGDKKGQILMFPWKDGPAAIRKSTAFGLTPAAQFQQNLISPHFGELAADSFSGATFRPLGAAVNSLQFSRDGRYLLSATKDGVATLLDLKEGSTQVVAQHDMGLWSAAFFPAEKADPAYLEVLTACSDKIARLWTRDGKLLSQFAGHESMVACAVFSPSGQYVCTAAGDSTARLWDANGRQLRHFIGHAESVWAAAFSPDGSTLITASWDKTVRLWQVASGRLLQTYVGATAPLYTLAVSPDGKYIAAAGADQSILLWESGRDCLEPEGEMMCSEGLHAAGVQLEPEDLR